MRNHHDGGWITAAWSHLTTGPTPFGDAAWRQAQQVLTRRGEDPTNEAAIAATVAALLDKAAVGPAPGGAATTKRDRRVAARTRVASADSSWLRMSGGDQDTDPEPVGRPRRLRRRPRPSLHSTGGGHSAGRVRRPRGRQTMVVVSCLLTILTLTGGNRR